MGELWTLREYVPDDEDCVISMWIRGLWRREHPRVREPTTEFWARYQPVVTALVRGGGDVVVACDPARVAHEPGLPAVIFGWSCTSGDLVLGVGVKNSIKKAGYGGDLATELLGDRLVTAQETVLRLPDLEELKLIPELWARRVGWTDELLSLVDRLARRDTLWNNVARFIVDPTRAPWVPSSERAA